MLASLSATTTVGGVAGMREMETEQAVIWPAWCYSAEGGNGGGADATRARRRGGNTISKEHSPLIKTERLSPNTGNDNRSTSRSRSVTPSTSSYPGTPPDRGQSPACPAPPVPQQQQPARNYSDIMRNLAARYNHVPNATSDFFHPRPTNGFNSVLDTRIPALTKSGQVNPPSSTAVTSLTTPPIGARTSPVSQPEPASVIYDQHISGLFSGFPFGQTTQQKVQAFPLAIDMSSTKTLLALAARTTKSLRHKRLKPFSDVTSSPLDLSAGAGSELTIKRPRLSPALSDGRTSESSDKRSENGTESCSGCDLSDWSVNDVCSFVENIDICAEYAPNFREQCIDGSGLPLLTEDHLTGMLQMKLGPALKLKSILNKKLQNCSTCRNCNTPNKERLNGSSSHASVKNEPTSSLGSPS